MELVESVLKKAQRISNDRFCHITSNLYANFRGYENKLTVHLDSMVHDAVRLKDNDVIWHYCVDRVFRAYKLFDSGQWKIEAYKGYYDDIYHRETLLEEPAQNIIQVLTEIDKLDDINKIKKCLELEYGYLIKILEHASVASVVEGVSLDNLILSETYMKKISRNELDIYKSYKLPYAVCIRRHEQPIGLFEVINGYSVIDGYHRVLSAQKNKVKLVSIILLD
jgi:hypothetical protein